MNDLGIEVIDDAAPDPGQLRAEALATPYHQPHPHYPWYLSDRPTRHACTLLTLISTVLGEPLHDADLWDQSRSAGRFNLFLAGADPIRSVHSDPYLRAAILFLSPSPPPGTGTDFVRHRSSGAVARSRPSDDADLRASSPIDSSYDLDDYDVDHRVENRFNRLVVFDAQRFHTPAGFFGGSPLDGRLTLTFFANIGRSYRRGPTAAVPVS